MAQATARQPALTASGVERRAGIVETAARLFNDLGYHNTSTAAIAEAVGTAKATVYHYFRAKHEILYEIHDEWIDNLIVSFENRDHGSLDAKKSLEAVIQDLVGLMHTKPGHVRVFFEFYRELPPALQALAQVKRDHYAELVEATIVRGMSEGALKLQDSRTVTFALFGMCNWTYQWYQPGGRLGPEQIAEHYYSIFMQGLEASPK